MLKKIATVFLLITGLSSFTQLKAQGEMEGGIYANYFQLGYRGQPSFGGQFFFPLGDRFTLNYRLSLGPANKGLYVHTSAGSIAGGYLMTRSGGIFNGNILNGLGALLFIVPEGVGFYIKEEGRFKPHLSINPLGFEYWRRWKAPQEDFAKMSGSVVFRMKMDIGDFDWLDFVAPEFSTVWIYTPGTKTAQIGFHLGVCIGWG
jgi:hypothetical protein